MDAFMPDMDGFEATREIKSRPGGPMIVIVSVSDGVAMEDEARAAGADAFLPKSEFAARLPGLLRDLLGEARPTFASPDARPARASRSQEPT
jgi:CheY-like chemotaxis protein